MKGRPAGSPNCKFLIWKYSTYDEYTCEWIGKKYITIKEIESEHNVRLGGECVKKLLKRNEEFDPDKQYTKAAFWTKYRNVKLEKIHEAGQYILLRI